MNYIYNNDEEKNKMLERFCRYVKIWSESDGKAADEGVFPSTERQWDFAKILVKELRNLGTRNVYLTDFCYVVAKIDSNIEDAEERKKYPTILLMAHIDTVDEVTGKDVKPVITMKDGDTIVKSDGTTLLGADDKAGVTAIMCALDYLQRHYEDIPHGPIEVMFSPDEETGHGMDKVPLNILKADFAVTVDGGDEGELESECFNAWAGQVKFTGKACHTGSAKKDGMVNAASLASNFVARLPRDSAPETTEGYEGFIAPMEISGSIESAKVELLLRAFNTEEIERQKNFIKTIADSVTSDFGGKAEVTFKQQYLNMKAKLDEHPEVMERLRRAFAESGVAVREQPIRGGTDGSRLTEMGIPTPNIFTGAHEFHSRNEWLSLNQCAKSSDVIINLLTQRIE
ncbi:MAG: tripeptide aminopeptidase PepT [Treponema sp.]|nr:tripeptide aminopeptidase PepT [Treponema sp.]